jgi:hypothetical protein
MNHALMLQGWDVTIYEIVGSYCETRPGHFIKL